MLALLDLPHNRGVDAGDLQRELQALQRGRGLRRPHVRNWVGPILCELAGENAPASEETLRDSVTALLTDALRARPRDLRFVIGVAIGLESDRPLLKDRLQAAGKVLDRDPRTLSRRLRQAEALLASELLQADRELNRTYESGPWALSRLLLEIDLDRERPVATVTQVVRPLQDALTEFRHTIAVAAPLPASEAPVVTAGPGCRLRATERVSDRSWVAVLDVPPVPRGRPLELRFNVEFPHRSSLLPFAAFSPIRPCASFDVHVQFGDPPVAAQVWKVNELPPALVTDRPLGARNVPLAGGLASVSFTGLRPGLAYGLAWSYY